MVFDLKAKDFFLHRVLRSNFMSAYYNNNKKVQNLIVNKEKTKLNELVLNTHFFLD